MKVFEVPLEEIKPYPNNPRITDEAVDVVAQSIEQFGWEQPLVLDNDKVIIVGHVRLLAAQKLGHKTAPCVIAKHLTPEQAKAYRLADNRAAELAKWDFGKLATEIKDLDQLGFNISKLGWDESALGALTGGAAPEPLPESDIEGADDLVGRFILIYRNESERERWCKRIGMDGGKVVYSIADIEGI